MLDGIPKEIKLLLSKQSIELCEVYLEKLIEFSNYYPDEHDIIQVCINTVMVESMVQILKYRNSKLSDKNKVETTMSLLEGIFETYLEKSNIELEEEEDV